MSANHKPYKVRKHIAQYTGVVFLIIGIIFLLFGILDLIFKFISSHFYIICFGLVYIVVGISADWLAKYIVRRKNPAPIERYVAADDVLKNCIEELRPLVKPLDIYTDENLIFLTTRVAPEEDEKNIEYYEIQWHFYISDDYKYIERVREQAVTVDNELLTGKISATFHYSDLVVPDSDTDTPIGAALETVRRYLESRGYKRI